MKSVETQCCLYTSPWQHLGFNHRLQKKLKLQPGVAELDDRPRYSPQIEVLQLLQAADLSGEVFDLVIEHVENFYVLQLRDVGRHR